MIHESELGIRHYESLDEARADGWTPIKALSPLYFFRLIGKRTTLLKANLEYMQLPYLILGSDGKYYFRDNVRIRDIDDMLYYYNQNDRSVSEEVETLHMYINDGRLWLLYQPDDIEEMKDMLTRVYQAKNSGEGTVPYKTFMQILTICLSYETFRNDRKETEGYKTICKSQEDNINAMWKEVYNKNNNL